MKHDGSGVRRVFHLTLFKCGSQWVRDLLVAPEFRDAGMPANTGVTVDVRSRGFPDVPAPGFTGPLYGADRSQWRLNARSGDRAIVVLRDPRDRIVSEIYSHLYSHGSSPMADADRDFMNRLHDPEDRIRYKVLRSAPDIGFCRSWTGCEDADVRVLRYEDLLDDQQGRLAELFEWLGVRVPGEVLSRVVDRLSFEQRSGRKRGDQNLLSHYRRGVAGDWRNHFTRELGGLWESLYPGALRELGYEQEDDWWRALPGHASESAREIPDEMAVVRERIRLLEREHAEKEAEIVRLEAIARERLELIERLDADLRQLHAEREAGNEITHPPELLATAAAVGLPEEDTVRRDLLAHLEEKELVIRELARALDSQRRLTAGRLGLHYPLRFFNHLTAGLRPRLGRLWHHPPRALRSLPSFGTAANPAELPTISIVTPSFNQGRFIARTLRSVFEQAYPKLEFRVQDGGSSDETLDVLHEYGDRLAGWVSEPDRGQTDAINRAFAATSGEIMGWLNSDDLLLPGALHRVAAYFQRHPDVDVVYGDRLLIDEDDREIGCWVLPDHDDEVLSWADFVPQETLFWRRRLWERVGGALDDDFRFAMDWDLLVRFREAGARFAHLNAFVGAFRIHEHQKTSAIIDEVGRTEMDRIRLRCLGRVPSQGEIRRALAPYLLRHLARHYARRFARV